MAQDNNYITWTIRKGNCTSVDTMVVHATILKTNVAGNSVTGDTLVNCGPQTTISAAPAPQNGTGKSRHDSRMNLRRDSQLVRS